MSGKTAPLAPAARESKMQDDKKSTATSSNNNYHLLSAPHMPCTGSALDWVTPLHMHNLGSTQCTLLSSPHFIDKEIEVLRGYMIFFSELAQ